MKDLALLEIAEGGVLGGYNLCSTNPVFVGLLEQGGVLRIGSQAFVTSRHTLDCSGGIEVGQFAAIAGHGSELLSHSIDFERDAQSALPIVIAERSFVGSRCLLLAGATVPERSMVAAGSVLPRSDFGGPGGLLAGVPAKRVAEFDSAWHRRHDGPTRRVYVPRTNETIEDAF